MWQTIISIVPETLKSIFGIVDQVVVDKDKANQIKLEVLTTLAGKGATSWLAANAFAMAMLVNFGLVVVLELFGRQVPDWSLLIALLWLAGPVLNTLSKETIGKIMEVFHEYGNNKAGDNSPAAKTGG